MVCIIANSKCVVQINIGILYINNLQQKYETYKAPKCSYNILLLADAGPAADVINPILSSATRSTECFTHVGDP